MIFHPLPLSGAFLIEPEPIRDQRGFFARTVCREEFALHGLNAEFVQQSLSWNEYRGTLRGMHYQKAPHEEEKLVTVIRGAIYDVILDLRADSSTFGCWYGVELNEENNKLLYIPKGFAHGFQTLCDNTKISYQMTERYQADYACGVSCFDPELAIAWPILDLFVMSNSDEKLPPISNIKKVE
ncbi:dTDP-4-dehydrorhamnose 3,5-epimerase [Deefgea rivuli]|uniref:dTDP-4-dehydrorhamnose 3,5-epimerase n=1 Tax=Deefgea rivuli TaxID=400948 RepID=UPI00048219EC|nr:dTDP-4-dehydrorhamnose 3,5-epimerase [Deefgea rivuli]